MNANPANPSLQQIERARRFLLRAVELSVEGPRAECGGPFGAVVARSSDDQIVGEGFNRVVCDRDPTAHAEVNAIRAACAKLQTFNLAGCEMFASSQPCPMCLAACYWARIERVWFANTVDQAAAIGFDDSLFYEELGRAMELRKLPQIHVVVPEAAGPFEEWAKNPLKTPY
jgi:tRNA(Arg) A34 adenosine deaminase TadA